MSITTEEVRTILEEATPGPWTWRVGTGLQECMLVTNHSGQYYIMGFERWGFHNAGPVFQTYEKYSGPVTERHGLGMVRVDKLAKPIPGKEHHVGYDQYIDHPDAKLIARAPECIAHLLAENDALRARADAAEQSIDTMLQNMPHPQCSAFCKRSSQHCRTDCEPEWIGLNAQDAST